MKLGKGNLFANSNFFHLFSLPPLGLASLAAGPARPGLAWPGKLSANNSDSIQLPPSLSVFFATLDEKDNSWAPSDFARPSTSTHSAVQFA